MSDDDKNTPADPDSDDPTPMGDTKEHSESAESGPEGPGPVEPGGGRYKRDSIGGEAEAETTIETD